jgi:hypothetical protein
MHKATTRRLGEGLRKEYRLSGDLPEDMEALLSQLDRKPGKQPAANDDNDATSSEPLAPDRPCRPVPA